MSWIHIVIAIALGAPSSMPAFGREVAAAQVVDTAHDVTRKPQAKTDTAPTEDECLELAQRLLDAVAAGDGAAIERWIDRDALLARMTAGVDAPPSFRQGFVAGVSRSFGEISPTARSLATLAGAEGGDMHFLRMRRIESDATLLFRVVTSDGLDYYEFRLGRRASGELAISDTFTFLSGEWLSETLRRFYVPSAAEQSKDSRASMSAKDRALADHVKQFSEFGQAVSAGKWKEALTLYDQLPAELQKEKYLLTLRLIAAQKIDEETYLAALEALRANYPDDPSLCLHAIDYYFLKKDKEKAAAAFATLDAAVGGDAQLDNLQASLLIATQDYDAALPILARGLEREPEMVQLWWLRVTCELGLEHFEDVYNTLVAIDLSFDVTWDDFKTKPLYAGFVASPWHAKWLEHLAEDKDG